MKRNLGSVLVVIVGVILAVDVAMRLAPQEAAAQPGLAVEPTVVSVTSEQIFTDTVGGGFPSTRWRIIRAWSDGQVDVALVRFSSYVSCNVNDVCPPEVIIPGI